MKDAPNWGITPVPERLRVLGAFDQFLLWANLSVSLLVIVAGAFLVLPPSEFGLGLSLPRAVAAIVAAAVVGNLLLGLGGLIGADARVPTMVLLRAPLGHRGSYLPTALNVVQCFGWAIFELIIIATGASALAIWAGFDLVLASLISWTPLVADYTRFSRTRRDAFWGAGLGYFVPTIPLFALGAVIALTRHISDAPALLTAIAAGGAATVLALLALTVDESDEAFANVYSGALSMQNVVPQAPQRLLVAATAAIATVGALVIDLRNYQTFLYLLGSFFVPLFGVVVADWLLSGRHYGVREIFEAPAFRPALIVAWLAGFCLYQWLYPNGPTWWTDLVLHTHPHSLPWGGASVPSFATAFGLTALARLAVGRRSILAGA